MIQYESLKKIEEDVNLIKERLLEQKSTFGWITEKQAMKLLDVSKSTIQRYRKEGILPFSQHSNKINYKLEDIQEFLEEGYSRRSISSVKPNNYA